MKYVYSFLILLICALGIFGEFGDKVPTQSSHGTAFDAVVVDTSLNVMQKKLIRGARGGPEAGRFIGRPLGPGPIMYPLPPPKGFFIESPANTQTQGFHSETETMDVI